MRLTVCLEGNGEGRVLSSIDMGEIVKMTITDDIERSNFNPEMLRGCTDTAYQCGYHKGKADGVDECINLIKRCFPCEEVSSFALLVCGLEQLKEKKNGYK